MTIPRFIATFSISAGVNDVIRVYATLIAPPFTPIVEFSLTIPPGTYSMQDDGTGDCFLTVLETAIEASAIGAEFEASINYVSVTDATRAPGRIKYTHSVYNVTFDLLDPLTTFDGRIMGFGSAGGSQMIAGEVWSTHVHRYGWYPQGSPVNDRQFRRAIRRGGLTLSNAPDGVDWGEYDARDIALDFRPAALVREQAATVAGLTTGYGLTTGDPNASLERFILDVTASSAARVTCYPDQGVTGTSWGPAVISDEALWSNPLARSSIADPAGEMWHVEIPLSTIVT